MTMHGRCGRGVENRLDVFVVRPGYVIHGPRLRWDFPRLDDWRFRPGAMSDWRYSVVSIVGGLLRSTGRALVFDAAGLRLSCRCLSEQSLRVLTWALSLPHASQMLGNKNPDRVANRMYAVHVVGWNRAGCGQ